jgi:hypothetical protein
MKTYDVPDQKLEGLMKLLESANREALRRGFKTFAVSRRPGCRKVVRCEDGFKVRRQYHKVVVTFL